MGSYVDRALELLDAGDFTSALETIEAGLAGDGDEPLGPALCVKGVILGTLERYDDALASLDQAQVLSPQDDRVHYHRGLYLQEVGRIDEALEAYSRATEIAPDKMDAWVNCGRLLDDECQWEKALACYDTALALEPADRIALVNRGNTLSSLERFEEALASYDSALATDPDDHHALLGRISALGALGRVNEANAARDPSSPLDRGDLHQLTRTLGDRTLVARFYAGRHSHPEMLAELAEDLVGYVAGLVEVPPGIDEGVKIGYGWSILTVRARGDQLILCEPDFPGNPFEEITHDVSFSLQTMFMINLLHSMVEVPPSDCTFVDAIGICHGALEHEAIMLCRLHETTDDGVSGWFLGPDLVTIQRQVEASEFDLIPTAALAQIRHHLIKALSLPAGYTVRFEGHAVVSVTDAEGKERWTEEGDA